MSLLPKMQVIVLPDGQVEWQGHADGKVHALELFARDRKLEGYIDSSEEHGVVYDDGKLVYTARRDPSSSPLPANNPSTHLPPQIAAIDSTYVPENLVHALTFSDLYSFRMWIGYYAERAIRSAYPGWSGQEYSEFIVDAVDQALQAVDQELQNCKGL